MRRRSAREAFEIAAFAAFVAFALAGGWVKLHVIWSSLNGACQPLVPVTSVHCGVDVVCLIGGAIVSTIVAIVWLSIGLGRRSAQRKLKT